MPDARRRSQLLNEAKNAYSHYISESGKKDLQVTICTGGELQGIFIVKKSFFIVNKSQEADNANVITEHFPLVPNSARLLGTNKSPLARLRFHGPF